MYVHKDWKWGRKLQFPKWKRRTFDTRKKIRTFPLLYLESAVNIYIMPLATLPSAYVRSHFSNITWARDEPQWKRLLSCTALRIDLLLWSASFRNLRIVYGCDLLFYNSTSLAHFNFCRCQRGPDLLWPYRPSINSIILPSKGSRNLF